MEIFQLNTSPVTTDHPSFTTIAVAGSCLHCGFVGSFASQVGKMSDSKVVGAK
jgi:hypothetical protein